MPSLIQRSFAGGELAPAVYGRADQVKYLTGLKTCRNFIVQRAGGVTNRPGTRFVAEVKDSATAVRLLKFVFNSEQTYVLEFGDQYMRVFRNGAAVEVSGVTAWSNATAYVVGDLAVSAGVNYYCIAAHTNQAPPNATYWYPLSGSIYEIPTPYLAADLPAIQYVQSADVITLVHASYAPRELARTGHTAWTLSPVAFEATIDPPANCAGTRGSSGGHTYRYRITAIETDTFQESSPGYEAAKTITGATQANPVVITIAGHGYAKGDEILIDGVAGMTELNGRAFKVGTVTTDTFVLKDEDGSGHTAYSSGGTARRTHITITAAGPLSSSLPNTLAWDDVAGAAEYNVYKEQNGVYGFAGTTVNNAFEDEGITPDASFTPPIPRNPFESDNHPSTVGYYQQRAVYASSTADPEKVWMSRTGNFANFSTRSPIQDDDAVTFTIAGRQVNQVRHLIDMGNLVILTAGSEWTAQGNSDGVVQPAAVNLRQQGTRGSAVLEPLIIGNSLLYLQARESIVRDLRYSFEADGYQGNDLTIFSSHLFDGYSVVDWDYQQITDSVVWVVRSDGTLLALTYLPEHQVWGWSRHDTPGIVEQACCVPEGEEDAVYLVVQRTIDGSAVRYVERMASRQVADVVDAFFVDAGLSYDGRNGDTNHTMTLSGGTTWAFTESLTLTSSASFFTAGDVGNAIQLTGVTPPLVCTITGYTSATVVTVQPSRDVPASLQATATSAWARAVDELTGLDHLEGETVSILADGNVAPQAEVSSGAVTLATPAAVIHAGLPITADFETLSMEIVNGQTIADRRKLITKVGLLVESSRGIMAGPDADHLFEYAQRAGEGYGVPTGLATGNVEIPVESTWNDNGRIFVRQSDPLPLTILAAIPHGQIGGQGA